MAKLISNVYVDGVGYGPDFGNAENVPAGVAAMIANHAWDKAPVAPDGATVTPPPATPDPLAVARTEIEQALADLAEVPNDKGALLAFAESHGLDVDGRLGVEKLRMALVEALGG